MEALKEEFEALRTAARDKIDAQLPSLSSSEAAQERRLVINQATRDLEEADEIIAEMEATLKNMPTSQKLKASAFVRFCRDAVRAARRDLAKYTTGVAFISDRTQLLSGATNHGATSISIDSADTRSRLLQSTERLQGGSQRLENIQRIALESETIGASTLGDLGRQREQIVRTRNTLDSADSWITQSTGVLRGMQWQATRGTLIQYGCIVILILLILIVFYFKYLK